MHCREEALCQRRGETTRTVLANEGDPTRAGRITLSRTTEQIALISGLEVGMKLLLDDGLMEIAVVSRDSAETVKCEVRRKPPVGPGADALGPHGQHRL